MAFRANQEPAGDDQGAEPGIHCHEHPLGGAVVQQGLQPVLDERAGIDVYEGPGRAFQAPVSATLTSWKAP